VVVVVFVLWVTYSGCYRAALIYCLGLLQLALVESVNAGKQRPKKKRKGDKLITPSQRSQHPPTTITNLNNHNS